MGAAAIAGLIMKLLDVIDNLQTQWDAHAEEAKTSMSTEEIAKFKARISASKDRNAAILARLG